jgi:flagellar biosynthesis GTPase FlhF
MMKQPKKAPGANANGSQGSEDGFLADDGFREGDDDMGGHGGADLSQTSHHVEEFESAHEEAEDDE